MKKNTHARSLALALALLTADAAVAQVAGSVLTTESKTITGNIKWKAREKVYAITLANKVEIELAPAAISELQIPRPKELDAAAASVQQGNAAKVIPALEKISNDYLMLQWDGVATHLLADAYVKAGEPEKAIRACEKVIASNPDAAYLGEMAPGYWQALLKANRVAKVEELLAKAVKSGSREASASALTMRGDVILASGDTQEITKKALRDGYLRVVTLYKSEKAAQPEALYKAAACFEKLGQTARAEQMRTTLKSEFGSSEWARKP
jgi:tetratricopeptide (TPR) repeat protein